MNLFGMLTNTNIKILFEFMKLQHQLVADSKMRA